MGTSAAIRYRLLEWVLPLFLVRKKLTAAGRRVLGFLIPLSDYTYNFMKNSKLIKKTPGRLDVGMAMNSNAECQVGSDPGFGVVLAENEQASLGWCSYRVQ